MKFTKFLSTALALSLVATTVAPVLADEVVEHDLDNTVFDSPTTSETTENADYDLDEQEFQSPDMGVGDDGVDMPTVGDEPEAGVGGDSDAPVPSAAFPDVVDEWFADAVETAVVQGYFTGYGDGNRSFNPNGTMSRAMFTVNMVNLRGGDVSDMESTPLWYENYFILAQEMGILPDSFTLDVMEEPITREEVACFMIKALGQGNFDAVDGNEAEILDYDSIGSEYASYVTQAYQAGLLMGDNRGFRPQDTMSRYEVAFVVNGVHAYFHGASEENVPEVEEELVGNDLSESYKAIIDSLRDPDTFAFVPCVTADQHVFWETTFTPSWNITPDQFEGYAIAMPTMNTVPFCVAVVKPVEGEMDAVKAGLQTSAENWKNEFYPMLQTAGQNAIIEVVADDLVIFVMMEEGGQELVDALKDALTLG